MKKSNKSGKRNRRNNPQGAFAISSAGDQIVKRLSFPLGAFATGAGTSLPITAVTSGDVQSRPATEWASFAARYQQYRVRAIRITGKAINPVQTAALTHSVLYRGDYIGTAAPTTPAQVLSDENVKMVDTHSDFVDIISWNKNPNAKLWNPTSAIIPGANQYAWVAGSATVPAMSTGLTYYALTAEWEVEFRGSQ